MSNIRSIGGSGFDPYCNENPLGLSRRERADLHGTPEYEEKMRALETIEALRDATSSALVHEWAEMEEARVTAGEELNLEGLYYTLQADALEVSDELQERVVAYRKTVSDLTTMVRSSVITQTEGLEVGFGDEDELLSA